MTNFQLTFAIIKPHVLVNCVAWRGVREIIISNGFQVVQSKRTRFSKSLAEQFYREHSSKFFYNRLVTFMSSGSVEVLILGAEDAISKWRAVMGPTKVYQAIYSHPDSIRGKYGLSDTRNACHGSDTPTAVEREISIVWPDFNFKVWNDSCRKYFAAKETDFIEEKFNHCIRKK